MADLDYLAAQSDVQRACDVATATLASLMNDRVGVMRAAIERGMANPGDPAALAGAKLAFQIMSQASRLKLVPPVPEFPEWDERDDDYVDSC